MRNIFFKAKREDTGEWVEGYYTYYPNGMDDTNDSIHVIRNTSTITNKVYFVNPETLCQFTGLYDKNSKKIWENDIVKCEKRGSAFYRCRVVWDDYLGRFDVLASGCSFPLTLENLSSDNISIYGMDYEVIDDSDKEEEGIVEGIIKTLQGRLAAAVNHEESVIFNETEIELVITVINILFDMVRESHSKSISEKENSVEMTFTEIYEKCFRQ